MDPDEPAGGREGVDGGVIDQEEGERLLCAGIALGHEARAQRSHIGLELGVLDEVGVSTQVAQEVLAETPLLLGRDDPARGIAEIR